MAEPKIIDWQERLVKQVKDEWDKGYQYVDDLNRNYDDIYKMLRGERPEKNYDWQSNVVINKVFQVVWTTIPYIIQKIFGANPIMGIKGPAKDDKGAHHREKILEYWHTMQPATNSKQNPFKLVMIMWLLRSLLNGVGILKKTWHQKIDVDENKVESKIPIYDETGQVTGQEPYETTQKKTTPVEDWPYNIVVNNRDIVCDWLLQPGQSIRQGRFIIHREMTDLEALWTSPVKYINLKELNVEATATDTELKQDHSHLTGKDGQETTPESDIYTDIEIHERVGIFPTYNEKKNDQWIPCFDKDDYYSDKAAFREMIITTVPDQKKVIRFEPNPYGEKNYIDIHIYLDAERWHSMGQVEPFKDMQTALNDNINAVFDEIWQNLFSPVVVNKYALWDWDTMQYAPHQRWLVGGDPSKAIQWKQPTNITQDAWQKHMLFDNEINLTSAVTPPVQGMGKEKAATTNVLNAQMSAGKLDFLVGMVEITGLVPSAQMDVRFASMFAHPKTFQKILGETFKYGDFGDEVYQYVPAASSVKLEHQKSVETQEDLQLLQVFAAMKNPKAAAVMNVFLKNILRNRNMDKEAAAFDEEYFEPSSEAGNVKALSDMIDAGATSNEQGIDQGATERNVRQIGMRNR